VSLLRQGEYELKNKGFSLLEVLIGLVILAVGILAIAALQTTSVRGNFFSHNLMQGTYVAQDRLESLKNMPFDSNELNPGNYNEGPTTISGIVFNRTYQVVNNPSGYKEITYTVSWNDGVDHRISFSTIRSQ
jgi:type IV pilus modification protein PilV